MERPDVKEDMIIHCIKNQYTLEGFMSIHLKDLKRDKVNGHGWYKICSILNIKINNSRITNENREAIAQKVWE